MLAYLMLESRTDVDDDESGDGDGEKQRVVLLYGKSVM